MIFKDMLQGLFEQLRAANPNMPEDKFAAAWSQVEDQLKNEPPPKIALIGETGVGKSSTINALFNAGQDVSHVRAMTQTETAIQVKVDTVAGGKGVLVIYDMPGLGESKAADARHLATYERVLAEVDVVLWIMDAHDRAIAYVQEQLSGKIRPINPDLVDRMVFALNKVDLVQPMDWHPLANLPSLDQENNIKARLYDVQMKVREALPRWKGTPIGYSAIKHYNLPQLFITMLDAVPRKRQWMLTSRKALADFLELVDPRLIPENKRTALKQSDNSPEDMIASVVDNLSDEELAELMSDRSRFKDFIKDLIKLK